MTIWGNKKILAEEHWQWIEGLLKSLPDNTTFGFQTIEYLYKTAFIHGYKHGADNTKKEVERNGN